MFYDSFYTEYEEIIKRQLKSSENKITINVTDKSNQRTIADKIQDKTVHVLKHIFSNGINGSIPSSNRDMADFLIKQNDFSLVLDIKTRNINKKFSMPNITSIKRLFRLYQEKNKTFGILSLDYEIKQDHIEYQDIYFIPYYHIDVGVLTIGNLGHGQLQVKKLKINRENTEKEFMMHLKDKTLSFYRKLASEITEKKIPFIEKIIIK